MIWVAAVLSFFLLLDALRMRSRLAKIPELSPSDEPESPEHRFIAAEGVTIDAATRRAASAHAKKHGIKVLDLVPGDLSTMRAWAFLQFIDPVQYRKDRPGRGASAGHAALVTEDVLDRARATTETLDEVAFVRLVARLKRYASTATDLAVAPGLHGIAPPPPPPLAVTRELIGNGVNGVLVGLPLLFGILGAVAWFGRPYGAMVFAAVHLQPLLAFTGTSIHPSRLLLTLIFRTPMELWGWLRLVFEPTPSEDLDRALALRPDYDALLAGGLDRFFEPRLDHCPLCQSKELRPLVRTSDLMQHKPGRFVLERCKACDHVFQNPRLSIDGLNFYYRDFYDGLGEDQLDQIFGVSGPQYIARAKAVSGFVEPHKWLDVGGGHGHFCCAAREVWPKTTFDALDLSESIDEAVRRGWVDHGYRGLFPDLAGTMKASYDVVSMSHYLEHTRDPEAEIAAASTALEPGGVLFIEVPDPDCFLGGVLRRLWLPWFQPQHQHFVSVRNIDRLLRAHDFEPVLWHRGEAHQPVDFLAAVVLFVNWIAPVADLPWRPKSSWFTRRFRTFVYLLAVPALIAGRTLDVLFGVFFGHAKASNTYRVVAKKGAAKA